MAVGRALVIPLIVLALAAPARGEESFTDKIKHALQPTPTPRPHHRRKKVADDSDDEKKPTPNPKPSASRAVKKKAEAKHDDADDSGASRKKPTPTRTEAPSPAPSVTPSQTPTATPTPTPPAVAPPNDKKKGAPSSIPPDDIVDYEKYPPGLRKVTDLALDLAGRNLQYKYGSADPATGGMDCSGFVYYVLNQLGVKEVPRDSSQQYVWARKAGTFRAVNSRADETFELNELKPGDLLFWTGTYSIERDPPITHAMIYLGREKKTGHRIMVGASDGRAYKGESRFGVSVFDFKIAHPPRDKDAKLTPTFIGYAHVPGLNDR